MSTSFGWEGKGRYMVHSDSGWTRGVQVKLWDPLRTRAIPERLRGVFTTRRYTIPRLPLPLPHRARVVSTAPSNRRPPCSLQSPARVLASGLQLGLLLLPVSRRTDIHIVIIKPGYPGLKAVKPVIPGLKNTPPPRVFIDCLVHILQETSGGKFPEVC